MGLLNEVVLRDELTADQPLEPPGVNALEGVPFHIGMDSSQIARMPQEPLRLTVGEVTVLRHRCLCPAAVSLLPLASSLEVQSV